jgi:hypothetical protein
LSLLSVVCRQLRGLYFGLITRPEDHCGVCLSEIYKPTKGGGLGSIWAVAPQERKGKAALKIVMSWI